MILYETSIFTKQIGSLLEPESYRLFQWQLVANPDKGDLIPGTGGLRKIRWSSEGHGKRGGIRVIYYWIQPNKSIFLLLAYKKNKASDLSESQKKILKEMVRKELDGKRSI